VCFSGQTSILTRLFYTLFFPIVLHVDKKRDVPRKIKIYIDSLRDCLFLYDDLIYILLMVLKYSLYFFDPSDRSEINT